MADIHYFNIEIAKLYGVNSAVLLQNIYHWIQKNRANGKNEYDGHFWTYNSRKAFAELFPYMNERQIDYALKKLIDDGVLITGNYNKVAYDRTLWYAITKKGYSILQNCEMEETKVSNGSGEIVEPIPDINTNEKPVKRKNNKKQFIPPTVEEIAEYCKSRNNNVNPQKFFDYYNASEWEDAKGVKVRNWKQKVITWERNDNKSGKTYGATGIEIKKPAVDDLAGIL